MWNGDLLLGHGAERHKLHFQILDKSLQFPARKIEGEYFDEGPAVSRVSNNIAWTLPEQKQIYAGKIKYTDDGQPEIVDKELVIDEVVYHDGVKYDEIRETQDLNPADEKLLIWNQYHRNEHGFRSDIFTIHLDTGEIINHTKSPYVYHEAENIFPDGNHTTVESDVHRPTSGTSTIDIYKLELDRSAAASEGYQVDDYLERMTFFSEVEGFRSSNPVISDDGSVMAFQGSIAGTDAGVGCGIYLFDIDRFEE